MAKFGKRTEDKDNTPAITTEETEEVLLPGEGPAESAPTENVDWQGQLNAAFDPTALGDITSPEDNDTPQEENEMTETATENATLTERLENDGFKVTDAAANLLAEVEKETTPMLDIDSIPKDARILKMQLEILSELADDYKSLKQELTDGTSGKDEKVAGYIANLDETGDENGLDLRDAFEAAREAREEAIRKANEAEAAFLAHVENELSKRGGGVMSEEDIAAKTAEIKLKYSEYVEQHKAAKNYLDNYRTHKNDSVGEIHQYVTHIDRPSGRATSAGTSRTTGGPTAGRSVHVSGAFFSKDGGASWEHSTTEKKDAQGKVLTLSNPASLAVDLGKAFSTTVSKDEIIDAWYSASDQTRETATKANMPNEKVFPLTFKDGNGNDVTAMVKIQKRQ